MPSMSWNCEPSLLYFGFSLTQRGIFRLLFKQQKRFIRQGFMEGRKQWKLPAVIKDKGLHMSGRGRKGMVITRQAEGRFVKVLGKSGVISCSPNGVLLYHQSKAFEFPVSFYSQA